MLRIPEAQVSNATLSMLAGELRRGAILLVPTETVYGIAVNPLDPVAVRRIFEVKGRVENQPILLLVDSEERARDVCHWNVQASALAARHWPGPLTMVLPAKSSLPDELTAATGTVGVRWGGHPFVDRLIRAFGSPVTGTSANRSGEPPATSGDEAVQQLGDSVDIIVDAGRLPVSQPSTVVDLTTGKMRVIRSGAVRLEV